MIRFIVRESSFWVEYVPTWNLGHNGQVANFFHIFRGKIELDKNLEKFDQKIYPGRYAIL